MEDKDKQPQPGPPTTRLSRTIAWLKRCGRVFLDLLHDGMRARAGLPPITRTFKKKDEPPKQPPSAPPSDKPASGS